MLSFGGGVQIYANIRTHVGYFSLLLAFLICLKQQNQLYVGISDHRPVKDSC